MQQGFNVTSILMDGKFACIRGNLTKLYIDIKFCSNSEHVGEIKRLNRIVKQRVRVIYNTISFEKIPGSTIIEIVTLVIFYLNAIPHSPSEGGGGSS